MTNARVLTGALALWTGLGLLIEAVTSIRVTDLPPVAGAGTIVRIVLAATLIAAGAILLTRGAGQASAER